MQPSAPINLPTSGQVRWIDFKRRQRSTQAPGIKGVDVSSYMLLEPHQGLAARQPDHLRQHVESFV